MYELRTLVIEPKRRTYRHVQERVGDRAPTRYEEATIGVQSLEGFHYRPLWAPDRDLYDPAWSRLRVSDPDAFLDPRQFYYGSYVMNRAQRTDALGQMVQFVQERDLASMLPDRWIDVLAGVVIPLRHYEAGANLISINAARFAWGAPIGTAAAFSAMDRLANAQLLTEGGLSLPPRVRRAGGTEWLATIKQAWIEHPAHQPARKMIEELLIEPDWAVGLVALDLADSLIFPLLFSHLVERAFTEGVSYYSLPAPFVWQWYQEQAKWLGVLRQTWLDDPEHGETNAAALADIARQWRPSALGAARALAGRIDELMGDTAATDFVERRYEEAVR